MSRKRATNLASSVGVSGQARDSSGRVVLCRGKARPLWFGHPWVYANAVERLEGEAAAGDIVSLVDHDGHFIGRGIFNPRSQIPVRLLTRKDEAIDAAFFVARLREAQALRTRLGLPNSETTAYRLVNSEGDSLPGLVVDVFADAAVVQITTLGLALRRDAIFAAVEATLSPRTMYEVAAGSYAEVEGLVAQNRVVQGEPRNLVACLEDGLRFEAEPLAGQKTGMFLDQRPNRMRVGQMARAAQPHARLLCLRGWLWPAGGSRRSERSDRGGQLPARSGPHRGARRRQWCPGARGGGRCFPLPGDRYAHVLRPGGRGFRQVRTARKDVEAATKGYERLNTLALTVCVPGALLGDLFVLAKRRRARLRTHRRGSRQAGPARGRGRARDEDDLDPVALRGDVGRDP